MVRRRIKNSNKKYVALIFGFLIVALLAGNSLFQSTYTLNENWSLQMSITDIKINGADEWPGDYVKVIGDSDTGYDFVSLSVDDVGPVDPAGDVSVLREDTGKPTLAISLGSFTQPTAAVDDQSVPGSKIYTWHFTGYISIQTISAESVVNEYTYSTGSESAPVNKIAELGTLDVEVFVDFSLNAGPEAIGTCMIVNTDDILGLPEYEMINSFGVSAENYEYDASLKVATVSSLEAGRSVADDNLEVSVTGQIASGAEIFEGDMLTYNAYVEYPINFEVVQTVSEFDNARFSVPNSLSQLPMSFDDLFAEEALAFNLIVIIMIPLIIVIVCYAGARWSYGDAGKVWNTRIGPPVRHY